MKKIKYFIVTMILLFITTGVKADMVGIYYTPELNKTDVNVGDTFEYKVKVEKYSLYSTSEKPVEINFDLIFDKNILSIEGIKSGSEKIVVTNYSNGDSTKQKVELKIDNKKEEWNDNIYVTFKVKDTNSIKANIELKGFCDYIENNDVAGDCITGSVDEKHKVKSINIINPIKDDSSNENVVNDVSKDDIISNKQEQNNNLIIYTLCGTNALLVIALIVIILKNKK